MESMLSALQPFFLATELDVAVGLDIIIIVILVLGAGWRYWRP